MDMKEERISGLMKLKLLITKVQRSLFFSASRAVADLNAVDDAEEKSTAKVPNDVKKGHFAVVAVKGGEPKRFIVEMGILSNPEFLRLLEQAEEEYGFQQKGVLAVPCLPKELQDLLDHKRHRRVTIDE